MTDTFATAIEFTARVSATYSTPENIDQLLTKASELIDFSTSGNAQLVYDSADAAKIALLSDATCDQVEYWMEVGEELDVTGLHGALTAGRLQLQNIPPTLGPRCLRTLLRGGIYYGGVGVMG